MSQRNFGLVEALENRRLLSVALASIAANSAVEGTPTDTLVRAEKGTLTATAGTVSSDDKITQVIYFIDSNSNGTPDKGEFVVGKSGNAAKNFAVTKVVPKDTSTSDPLVITAVARGKQGKDDVSAAVTDSVTVINDAPTLKKLTAAPKKVKSGKDFTLIATGAKDKDGTIAKVEFWFDVNGNGVIDVGTDQLDFTDSDKAGGFKDLVHTLDNGVPIAAGTYKFLAQATDSDGGVSNVVSVDVTVI